MRAAPFLPNPEAVWAEACSTSWAIKPQGRVSARGAERLAARNRNRSEGDGLRETDPNLTALVDELRRSLKRKVRIVKAQGKRPGLVEIEYYDDDDLTALAATLSARPH